MTACTKKKYDTHWSPSAVLVFLDYFMTDGRETFKFKIRTQFEYVPADSFGTTIAYDCCASRLRMLVRCYYSIFDLLTPFKYSARALE